MIVVSIIIGLVGIEWKNSNRLNDIVSDVSKNPEENVRILNVFNETVRTWVIGVCEADLPGLLIASKI